MAACILVFLYFLDFFGTGPKFPVYDTNHSSVLPKNAQIYKQTTL